jgi:hypothetical protein
MVVLVLLLHAKRGPHPLVMFHRGARLDLVSDDFGPPFDAFHIHMSNRCAGGSRNRRRQLAAVGAVAELCGGLGKLFVCMCVCVCVCVLVCVVVEVGASACSYEEMYAIVFLLRMLFVFQDVTN